MNIHNKSLVGKQVDRRAFLVAAGTASAITMGYGIVPMGVDMAFAGESGKISPSLFFDIHGDGQIVVHIAKAEMGQHVGTALAQVLIEELEADWDKVELSYVSFNPAHGLHITGGSWSVNWTFDALSRAGAAGRIALIEAAATKLGGKASDYSVSKGVITGNGKTISYGEIAASGIEPRAFSEDDLKALKLKAAGERKLVGQSVEALDIPDKTRGKATYGIDAKIDGMVYATPAVPPVRYGAKVISVDDSEAKKIKGYERFVTINDPIGTQTGLVMAIANSYWAANQASLALKVEYDLGPNAKTSLETIHAESARLIKTGEATRLIVNDGDADAAIKASDKTHTATYTTGVNIHAPLEPMNCTVEIKDGVYNIHAGNQFQTLLVGLVEALGVPKDKIKFNQYLLGGGFGRRLDADYVIMACLTAREVGKPVKLIFSREADTLLDFTRPAATIEMHAGTTGKKINGWKSSSASAWASARQAPAFLAPDLSGDKEKKYDGFAVNGADHWYSIDNQNVLLSMNEVAQAAAPPGHLRAVGPGWQFFAVESFIDEIAKSVGVDPLEYRLMMLDGKGKNAGKGATANGALRLASVLKSTAERAGYGKTMGANSAIGLACVSSQERPSASWTACAAHVTVDPKDGSFKVNKLTLGMDVGTCINPNGVEAQLSGSAMWGFSIATLEDGDMQNGAIQADNFDTYTPARMSDAPELDIAITHTENYPTGCGEPGTTVVAPAIANAIFAATGARVRSLPITAEKVKKAMG